MKKVHENEKNFILSSINFIWQYCRARLRLRAGYLLTYVYQEDRRRKNALFEKYFQKF